MCEGTHRDDSQGFWLGDYADDGDGSQARGHGKGTHLMEEKLTSVLVLWIYGTKMFDCLVTMRSKLITEVKKDDIEANYSRLKSNLALLFFFHYHFLIMDLSG